MPIGDLLAQITGEPSPTVSPTTQYIPKRKASGDFTKPEEKIQRTNTSQPASSSSSSSRPTIQPVRSSAVASAATNVVRNPNPSPTANFKNGRPTPPPITDPAVQRGPPKKGSFAEVMARAKQAQASLGQVGKIQHKKIEKAPSKRERDEMKKQKTERIQKNLGPTGKFKSAVPSITKQAVDRKETKAPVPDKKPKKAAVASTGYAGTARPKPGAGKSTLNSAASSSRNERAADRYRNDRRSSSHRRDYASEEDDEQDYDSDASSDMEAEAFELEEEEEQAARIARKEDAEALAEENRLKREKEEKKRRLAAMAKGRR